MRYPNHPDERCRDRLVTGFYRRLDATLREGHRPSGKVGANILRLQLACLLTLTLVGCQTASQESLIWVRTDGLRSADNPSFAAKHEVDKTICIGEVQKSAAGAPIIYYQGLAGAISASMIQNQQQRASLDIMKGCMAQRGYVLVSQSHAAAVSTGFRKKL